MSDDLVELLRIFASSGAGYVRDSLAIEAAAEIARLRDALKKIDAVAVAKKAGASREMQRIARDALAKKDAANVR